MRLITPVLLTVLALAQQTAHAQPTQFDASFDGDGELESALPSPPAPFEARKFNRIAVDDQNRTVIVGYGYGHNVGDPATMLVGRLLPDGIRDPSFGSAGIAVPLSGAETKPSDILVMPDNSIYVCGMQDLGGIQQVGFVLRLRPDGTLDSRFAATSIVPGVFFHDGAGRGDPLLRAPTLPATVTCWQPVANFWRSINPWSFDSSRTANRIRALARLVGRF